MTRVEFGRTSLVAVAAATERPWRRGALQTAKEAESSAVAPL